MSVIKSKRKTSVIQYIYNARLLAKYTLSKVNSFSKRYKYSIGKDISDSSLSIYDNAIKANAIYITNKSDFIRRRNHINNAKIELEALVSKIELAQEIFRIKPNVMEYWMKLISIEYKLVLGVISNDKVRYKFDEKNMLIKQKKDKLNKQDEAISDNNEIISNEIIEMPF